MRILIVEDEAGVAGFIQQGLNETGYVVDVANNGLDGLEYALAFDYDAIILDIIYNKSKPINFTIRLVKCPICLK